MIIISSFKDYYDSIAGYGISTDLRYIRETKIVKEELKCKKVKPSDYYYYNSYIDDIIIGFCGKIYYCYKFYNNGMLIYTYSLNDIINQYIANLDFKNTSLTNSTRKRDKILANEIRKWKKRFLENEKEKNNYEYVFLKYRTPIFVYKHDNPKLISYSQLIINDRLNKYEFFKIFEPYAAYQEIFMFLAKMASPEKPIPKIDDKTLASAKGFDKFSFRKEKQK